MTKISMTLAAALVATSVISTLAYAGAPAPNSTMVNDDASHARIILAQAGPEGMRPSHSTRGPAAMAAPTGGIPPKPHRKRVSHSRRGTGAMAAPTGGIPPKPQHPRHTHSTRGASRSDVHPN